MFCKYLWIHLIHLNYAVKTFLALVKKLCIFNNLALLPFYHVQGSNSCNFGIDKNRFKWTNGSVFPVYFNVILPVLYANC